MIDAYYGGCAACTQPGGYKILRIGSDGHVEELGEDGTYAPASGDYYVPPPAAREGGSAADQKCLAAANAENVMHEIYMNLADSLASHLSEAEALTALIEFLIVTLGAEFAPITYGLAIFLIAVFGLVYSALSYLTADLWDSNFTEAFKCMLLGCATNDAGVVTFDWDCVEHALYAAATTFGINETQLRLYLQINYILAFIGGIDALNTAGANTGITSADCTDCNPEWCRTWDFTVDDGSADGWYAVFGTYVSGTGYVGVTTASGSQANVYIENDTHIGNITKWDMTFLKTAGGGSNNRNHMEVYDASGLIADQTDNPIDTVPHAKELNGDFNNVIHLTPNINSGTSAADVVITQISLRGTGENPWGEDNC